jgi:NitT/TauT family transport system substrate-binding protein
MKLRSIFASLAVLSISSSLIIGCDKSAQDKSNPETSPAPKVSVPADTIETASTAKTLRLGFSNWPGYMPWHVGDKAKLFKSEKHTLLPVWYDDYLKGIGALVSGQLDANSQTLIDTVLSVAEGSDQVVVLVNDNSTGNDKIIAKAGINSIADLKGKVVATEKGTVDHYLLLLALKKAGLKESDVSLKFMGINESANAFVAGEVDATSVFAPATNTALKRPGSKELASSKDFPGAISDVLAFRREFIDKHPEIVQETVNTWFKSLAHIKANSAKSNDLMAKQSSVSVAEYATFEKGIKIFDVADNLNAFKPGKDNTSLYFNAEDLKKTLISLGLTKKSPDVSKMFDDRFVKAYAEKNK